MYRKLYIKFSKELPIFQVFRQLQHHVIFSHPYNAKKISNTLWTGFSYQINLIDLTVLDTKQTQHYRCNLSEASPNYCKNI